MRWIGSRFLDPIGRVFEFERNYYRAIYPHATRYVDQLLDSGVIREAVDRGLLVNSRKSEFTMEGYGFVLEHQTIPFVTYAEVWNRRFYRDAALCGIDLNLALMEHGLGTIDFHTNNILQGPNCKPVWVDLGSIAPLNQFDSAAPLAELTSNFLHPLFLISQRKHLTHIARFLAYQLGGITGEQFRDLTGATLEFDDKTDIRKSFLAAREWLEKMEFPAISTMWDKYQAENYVHDLDRGRMRTSADKRTAVIHKVLERFNPKSVVDLSCNAGRFSLLAAIMGADTYAVDLDEEAVDRMYEYTRKFPHSLSITAAVHDVMKPPRALGELTLGLALTHHLSLSQHHRLENIAERFAACASNVLLTEFMPNGLGSTVPVPDPLPTGYALHDFVEAHRPYFENIEIIYCPTSEKGSFRILVLCSNRRNGTGSDTRISASLVERDMATQSFIYRIVCPNCHRIFVNEPGQELSCPHCHTAPSLGRFAV